MAPLTNVEHWGSTSEGLMGGGMYELYHIRKLGICRLDLSAIQPACIRFWGLLTFACCCLVYEFRACELI